MSDLIKIEHKGRAPAWLHPMDGIFVVTPERNGISNEYMNAAAYIDWSIEGADYYISADHPHAGAEEKS